MQRECCKTTFSSSERRSFLFIKLKSAIKSGNNLVIGTRICIFYKKGGSLELFSSLCNSLFLLLIFKKAGLLN